jgi:hypothetical protein
MKFKPFLLILVVVLKSCSTETENRKENENTEGALAFFSDLPSHPFENLSFESELETTIEQLKSLGYKESKEQPYHYINSTENAEIILPESNKLTSLKIFFFNRKKAFYDELEALFSEKSSKQSKNNQKKSFSVYDFKTEKHEYSGTLFKMDQDIRISYKLKSKH